MRFSKTWAVPDLHGRYDLFLKATQAIQERGGGNVVFLGDYVDRGPQSREIIEAMISGPEGDSMDWLCLKGNHEDMMVGAIKGQGMGSFDDWLNNGGSSTIYSYPPIDGHHHISEEHVFWMEALPLFHETEHRIYCHAGGNPGYPWSMQNEQSLLWSRVDRAYDFQLNGKHVVHGHTPFADGPVLLPGRTNLDTGAYATGRLAIALFDEAIPGGPQAVLSIEV